MSKTRFSLHSLSVRIVAMMAAAVIVGAGLVGYLSITAADASARRDAVGGLTNAGRNRVTTLTRFAETVERALIHLSDPKASGALFAAAQADPQALRTRLRGYMETAELDDILLLDGQGKVVFAATEAGEAGQSAAQGALAQSSLGAAFAKAGKTQEAVFSDLAPYAPAGGAPVGFAAKAAPEGVIAIRLSEDIIRKHVLATPPAATTQVFLVGADGKLRSDLPRLDGQDALKTEFPKALELAGGPIVETTSVFGTPSLVFTAPVSFLGEDWVLVTDRDAASTFANVRATQQRLTLIIIAVALGGAALALLLSLAITRPIGRITGALGRLADGDYATTIVDQARRDEIGAMARSAEDLRGALAEAEQLRADSARRDREAQEARAAMLEDLDAKIGAAVGAARRGDFTGALKAEFGDQTLDSLAGNVDDMRRTVGNFLDRAEDALSRISTGDLGVDMPETGEGRYLEVARSLNRMATELRRIVGRSSDLGAGMAEAGREIANGSSDLARRVEQQAATVEEAAAMMEESSKTAKETATGAEKIGAAAHENAARGKRSEEDMRQVVSAMTRIRQSSDKISEITDVIDGIAFQTNLLALNASVEAARAGEAGKGFAVVASEVRGLATRAADAARDIAGLIEESGRHVEDGVKQVETVGAALGDLANGAESLGGEVAEILRMAREQADSATQMSGSLSQIDQLTQHNAAMAEESAAAADQLAEQTRELSDLLSFFRSFGGETSRAA